MADFLKLSFRAIYTYAHSYMHKCLSPACVGCKHTHPRWEWQVCLYICCGVVCSSRHFRSPWCWEDKAFLCMVILSRCHYCYFPTQVSCGFSSPIYPCWYTLTLTVSTIASQAMYHEWKSWWWFHHHDVRGPCRKCKDY